jgi:hypothetical protein
MRLHSLLLIPLAACALCASAAASVIGTNVIAQPVTPERVATLPRAQQKAWREYLARSEKQKAVDKAALQQEMKAANVTDSKLAPARPNAFGL